VSSPPNQRPEPAGAGEEPKLDAAAAAGFGGITWADELEDDAGGGRRSGASAAPAGEGDQPPAVAGSEAGDRAGGAATSDPGPASGGRQEDGASETAERALSVEGLVEDLERVTSERDQYLDASRRLQADFENYRKAVAKREIDSRQRANESLVAVLLPVLDACDGAVASGASDVEPVRAALLDALGKQGLGRIDDADKPFDPAQHDAVMHEPAEEGDGPVVAEVMRAGYSWKGRVIRPAMVRVRG
jgi:molecular chaperone GrpE